MTDPRIAEIEARLDRVEEGGLALIAAAHHFPADLRYLLDLVAEKDQRIELLEGSHRNVSIACDEWMHEAIQARRVAEWVVSMRPHPSAEAWAALEAVAKREDAILPAPETVEAP